MGLGQDRDGVPRVVSVQRGQDTDGGERAVHSELAKDRIRTVCSKRVKDRTRTTYSERAARCKKEGCGEVLIFF